MALRDWLGGEGQGGGSSTTSPGSLSSLSASTPLSELQALDHYLATGRMPKAPTKGTKVNLAGDKESLLTSLAGTSMNGIAERAGIVDLLARDILRELGLEMIVHVFFECGRNGKEFRAEMKELDKHLTPDNSMRMFMYFQKLLAPSTPSFSSSPPLLAGIVTDVSDV